MTEYRVTSGKVHTRADDGTLETYEAGETFEADLADEAAEAMEVEVVESDEGDDEGGAAQDETAPDESESEDETEDEGAGDVPTPLTESWVEDADYAELRSAAGEFDDVNGNWGEDRLRTELLDKAESEG